MGPSITICPVVGPVLVNRNQVLSDGVGVIVAVSVTMTLLSASVTVTGMTTLSVEVFSTVVGPIAAICGARFWTVTLKVTLSCRAVLSVTRSVTGVVPWGVASVGS